MPGMGCNSIVPAATAALSLWAIEADAVLLADDIAAIRALCETHGVTLIGIDSRMTS